MEAGGPGSSRLIRLCARDSRERNLVDQGVSQLWLLDRNRVQILCERFLKLVYPLGSDKHLFFDLGQSTAKLQPVRLEFQD